MIYPADEPARFRRNIPPRRRNHFPIPAKPSGNEPRLSMPSVNNGVQSCLRTSSTQFTAKFSGAPCPECTSSQPTDGYPGRRFPDSGRPLVGSLGHRRARLRGAADGAFQTTGFGKSNINAW
jgi:hypothetical protein